MRTRNLKSPVITIYFIVLTLALLLILANSISSQPKATSSQVAADTLKFSQVDFFLDGVSTLNSDWGVVELTFNGSDSILYFNLSINGTWQVQNAPVLSFENVGIRQAQNFWFDLGNEVGEDVTTLNYAYVLGTYILNEKPEGEMPAAVADESVVIYNGGADVDLITTPAPAVPLVGGAVISAIMHRHLKFPNQEAGNNECVPTAVSNSIQFLNTKHKLGLEANEMTIEKIKIATNWHTSGCWIWHDDNRADGEKNAWWEDKDEYMKKNKIPISTKMILPKDIGTLIKEIDRGQDIEAELNGHTVAVVGIKDLGGGRYWVNIAHDKEQGKPGGTVVEGGVWDSGASRWTSGALTSYGLNYFVVECPTVVEVDKFSNSMATVTVEVPVIGTETIKLSGPTKVYVYFDEFEGQCTDTDGDNLDQVPTEIVSMELVGISPALGPVTVRIRDSQDCCPFQPSIGEIEETYNVTPGWLDLPPFTENCTAESFFDMFFEIEVAGMLLHNHNPKQMRTIISHKPPREGERYENPDVIELYDENENPTGIKITYAHHIPIPIHLQKPAGWSLTSLRIDPVHSDLAEIFPMADIFGFNSEMGYYTMDQLETHAGFWLHSPDSGNYYMDGEPVWEYSTKLPGGWSIIGGLFDSYGLISPDSPTAVEAIFGFDPDSGYMPTEFVWPGEAVWIKCSDSTTVSVFHQSSQKQITGLYANSNIAVLSATGEIVGSRVNISRVNIGMDDAIADVIPAPPAPPEYTTQVRLFAPGDFLNAYYSDIRLIQIPPRQETWVLEVDPNGNTPPDRKTTISWDANDLIAILDSPWTLREGADGTGAIVIADMRNSTSFEVTGTGEQYFTITSSVISHITDQPEQKMIPERFALGQNYPNPFNAATKIQYDLPAAGHVSIKVYNIAGQSIKTLVDKKHGSGYYSVSWDGSDDRGKIVSNGIYLYEIVFDKFTEVRRMILLK